MIKVDENGSAAPEGENFLSRNKKILSQQTSPKKVFAFLTKGSSTPFKTNLIQTQMKEVDAPQPDLNLKLRLSLLR